MADPPARRRRRGRRRRGRAYSRAAGAAKTSPTGPVSTAAPLRSTTTRSTIVGDDRQVVADEQQRHAALAHQAVEQLEDLGLGGDVERGRRLVGDQQLRAAGERHGDGDALALAARDLVRIGARDAVGLRAGRPARAGRWTSAFEAWPSQAAAIAARRGGAAARRPAGRRCISGSSAVSGSWNTMAATVPRSRSQDAVRRRRSPAGRPAAIEPVAAMPRGSRPVAAMAVSDLPEPDSPIRPSRSPGPMSSERSETSVRRPGGRASGRRSAEQAHGARLRVGSPMSRRPSASRLTPMTSETRAMPGAMAPNGAV